MCSQGALQLKIFPLCRLLHPIMPYVTEELWQQLPKKPEMDRPVSIMISKYPASDKAWSSPEVEADMDAVNRIVAQTRCWRKGASTCTWLGFTVHEA